jgi:hypothetical protein
MATFLNGVKSWLRLLRGMTFGPVVCKKLAADFDKWEPEAWSWGDFRFYRYYLAMREYFRFPGEHGFIVYPSSWYEESGRPFMEPKLGADPVDDIDDSVGAGGINETESTYQDADI